jgi:DNA-binding LacI/PurR family transcriptional regulator
MSRHPAAAPTSTDVARLAGVSRATVSFVLNDTPDARVSEATRAKVRAAAEELGYIPHAAAATLRAGRTDLVLIPLPEVQLGGRFTRWLYLLQRELGNLGYSTILHGAEHPGSVWAARAWAKLRPTAVLGLAGLTIADDAVALLKQTGTRAVVTFGDSEVPEAHALPVDPTAEGACAARYLIDRGRRAIGVVVPADPGLGPFGVPRLRGVEQVAAAAGARVVRLDMADTTAAAAQLAAGWRGLGLDSVFGYNDDYAGGLMVALRDAGLRVPEDVAVVGADDLPLCELLRPRLTSVRLDLPTAADLAAYVDALVTDPQADPPPPRVSQPVVVPRESA